MKKYIYLILFVTLLTASCNSTSKDSPIKEKIENKNTTTIKSISQILNSTNNYNETTLDELPPWPEEMQIEGDLRQWLKVVFKGEQIVGVIWKSKPGKLQLNNYPYDEMVLVLEGAVTLQPKGEVPKTYQVGDVFFVPKGYNGTWEMKNDFKEFIIVEREAWISAEGE